MTMLRVVCLFFCLSFATSLQARETRKVEVRGWTGADVVVDVEAQGERMVDDVAKDYFFQTRQILDGKTGQKKKTFRRSESAGEEHPEFSEAAPESEGTVFVEANGLTEAVEDFESPDGRWFAHYVSTPTVTESEGTYRCELRDQVILFDSESSTFNVVFETTDQGAKARYESSVECSRSDFDVYWHPESSQFVFVHELRRPQQDSQWTIRPFSLGSIESKSAPVVRSWDSAIELVAGSDAELREVWELIFAHELSEARRALSNAEKTTATRVLILALTTALDGEEKAAIRAAREISKNAPDDSFHAGLLGAIYAAAGDSKRAQRHVQKAISSSSGFADLAAVGALFTRVDLSVANQVLIHALSNVSEGEDARLAYEVLGHALIDARQYRAAGDLLDRYEGEATSEIKLVQQRLALERRETGELSTLEDVLSKVPGHCVSHRIYGRRVAPERPADALRYLRAAHACDPNDAEAHFLAAQLELEAGRLERARGSMKSFLARAFVRRSDPVRDAQREHVEQTLKRIDRKGAVLTTAACRRSGAATLCRGTVYNTTDQPLEGLEAHVSDSKKRSRKPLATAPVDAIPAGQSRTFGIRLEKAPDSVSVSVGADARERRANTLTVID